MITESDIYCNWEDGGGVSISINIGNTRDTPSDILEKKYDILKQHILDALNFKEEAEKLEIKSIQDLKSTNYNSEFWCNFIENKETRLIDVDSNGNPKFHYVKLEQLIKNILIESNRQKRMKELIEINSVFPTEEGRVRFQELQNLEVTKN